MRGTVLDSQAQQEEFDILVMQLTEGQRRVLIESSKGVMHPHSGRAPRSYYLVTTNGGSHVL